MADAIDIEASSFAHPILANGVIRAEIPPRMARITNV